MIEERLSEEDNETGGVGGGFDEAGERGGGGIVGVGKGAGREGWVGGRRG